MLGVQVLDGIGVGYDISLEPEITSEPVNQPVRTSLYGLAVIVVVRAHHAKHTASLDNFSPGVAVNVLNFVKGHLRIHT